MILKILAVVAGVILIVAGAVIVATAIWRLALAFSWPEFYC